MKVDIHLTKRNRSTLVKLCKRLYSHFNYVKMTKKTITFKRKWWSLEKESMQVVDLVLLYLPQAINDLYEEYEFSMPFRHVNTLAEAVEYFGVKVVGSDIIQMLQYQLDNLDMSATLLDEYEEEPVLLKEQEEIVVKETYATKKAIDDTFDYFYNLMTDVIKRIHPKLKVVYMNTESACNSPPIRAPGYKVA
jgi:hypothetical protein